MIELRPAKYLLGRLAPMDNNDKIPQFNLGAGTYNSTVYLRGDGVWANPLAGAGFVPLTRELTINGVTYDLSANRTWTIDKASVGLGNVDNTSDLNKPISTATQTALNAKENTANKGIPGGYASLAGDGKVPSDQLPSYVDDVIEVANYAALPTVGQTGVIYITLDNNNVYRWAGSVYVQISQPNAVWGSITGTLSSQTDLQNALNAKQDDITLTTTGNSGAATFIGNTLNIPQYDGGLIGYVPYTGATTNVNLGEYGLSAGWVQIDTSPTTYTPGVGKLGWNDQDGTLEFQLKGGNVTLQVGQEQVARVVNKTDPLIDLLEANYQVVKVGGAQGNRLKVALAQANNDANSAETLGVVTETILVNQEGFITTSGIVRNINTTGSLQGETWLDGDMLFLSGTVAGQITKVKPSAPIHTVILGYVIRAHATQGQIYVKVDNGYELGELHDVNTTISKTTPVDTDSVLLQDTADSNIWKKLSWLNTKATLKTYFDTLYQAAGSYVPSSRTITINSTTQDLSANRSWTIDKASVGLGNVDNTSDLNKPISTATQTALNAKQDSATAINTSNIGAQSVAYATNSGLLNGYDSNYFYPASNPNGYTNNIGTVTSVGLSVPVGFNVSNSPITGNGTIGIAFASGYSLPTDANQSNWNQAYNDKINSVSVTGTTVKLLTLTQQDGGTLTTSWTDDNTDAVSSVFGRTGAVVAVSGDYNTSQVTENTNLYYTEARVNANANVAANTAARHNAVTLGTSNGLSLSTQQLSLGLASGSTTGALSATDWNTFNNKQNALTNPITGTGTTNYVSKFTGSGSIGDSQIFDNGTNVGVGTASPAYKLDISTISTSDGIRVANGSTSKIILYADGVATWGPSADYGRLTWDTGKAIVGALSGQSLSLGANGSWDQLYINTSGNVGIGTSSPNHLLSISSSSTGGSVFGMYNTVSNTDNRNWALKLNASSYGDLGFFVSSSNGGNPESGTIAMLINKAGEVAVGTSTPLLTTSGRGNITINGSSTSILTLAVAGTWKTYLFADGTDTHLSSANALIFGTNGGAERMRIASGGNVGIGTTSPANKLSIVTGPGADDIIPSLGNNGGKFSLLNNGGIYGLISGVLGSGDGYLQIQRVDGGATAYNLLLQPNGGNVGIGTTSPPSKFSVYPSNDDGIALTDSSNNVRGLFFINNAGGTYSTGLRTANYWLDLDASGAGQNAIRMFTGTGGIGTGTERMRITAGGNIGIGTTNPSEKLDVVGNARIQQSSLGGTIFFGSTSSNYLSYYNGDSYYKAVGNHYFESEFSYKGVWNSAGNLGIGTTNPTSLGGFNKIIHISGGYAAINLTSTIPNKSWEIGVNGTSLLTFYDGTADRMVINPSGNVGIGTTSPLHKLSVVGKIGANIFGDSYLEFLSNGNTVLKANNDVLLGYLQNTIIKQSGYVGIGTTTPAAKLDINANTGIAQIVRQTYTFNGPNYAIGIVGDGASAGYIAQNPANGGLMLSGGTTYYGAGLWRTDTTSGSTISLIDGNTIFLNNGGLSGNYFAAERMRITSDGNVGIGTTNPATSLELKRSEYVALTLNDTYVTTEILNTGGRFVINTPSQMRFDILSTPRVYVDAVSMGVNTASPFPSAALQVDSQTQGFLPPRMSDTEMNSISGPEAGLIVWNTDYSLFFGFDGSNWRKIQFV